MVHMVAARLSPAAVADCFPYSPTGTADPLSASSAGKSPAFLSASFTLSSAPSVLSHVSGGWGL